MILSYGNHAFTNNLLFIEKGLTVNSAGHIEVDSPNSHIADDLLFVSASPGHKAGAL